MSSKIPYSKARPKGVKEKTWIAVIDAWQNGLSDREAAFRASKDSNTHITESDIKEWMRENPYIASLRDYLHSDIISMAKLNVYEKIKEGDVATSKWYLERKSADEFSTKAAHVFEGAVVELSLEEKERKAAEFLEKLGD